MDVVPLLLELVLLVFDIILSTVFVVVSLV